MGFEPMMRVLQTLALPLGDVATYIDYKPLGWQQWPRKTILPAVFGAERAMGFEPTTFSLARRRTTAVLRPRFGHLAPSSAERQNRTDDTAIFSRVLYQLSYLGRQMFFVKRA
jgi:hypothetical protein